MTAEKSCRLLTELGHNIVSRKYHYPYGDRFIVTDIDDIHYYIRYADQKQARQLIKDLIEFYTKNGVIKDGRTTYSIL